MSNKLSLGTYDKKFINNILGKNPITSNQALLLDKIITRYHKQFLKKELNSNELLSLPWTNDPIESLPEYTEAKISIEGSNIIIKTPYNASYIKEIKKVPYPIRWVKTENDKYWSLEFSAMTFKTIVDLTEKNYTITNYCDTCKHIINYLSTFEDCKYWDPTLVYKNGSFMLLATNEPLYEHVKDILLDTSMSSVSKLIKYGVKLDSTIVDYFYESLKGHDDYEDRVKFILTLNPVMDMNNVETVIEYIMMIDSDLVILGPTVTRKVSEKEKIKTKLVDNNIAFVWMDSKTDFIVDTTQYKMPVFIDFGISNLGNFSLSVPWIKQISLVNNKPIQL